MLKEAEREKQPFDVLRAAMILFQLFFGDEGTARCRFPHHLFFMIRLTVVGANEKRIDRHVVMRTGMAVQRYSDTPGKYQHNQRYGKQVTHCCKNKAISGAIKKTLLKMLVNLSGQVWHIETETLTLVNVVNSVTSPS